jgi:hypothetical protein
MKTFLLFLVLCLMWGLIILIAAVEAVRGRKR